jgi:hypothetical protein
MDNILKNNNAKIATRVYKYSSRVLGKIVDEKDDILFTPTTSEELNNFNETVSDVTYGNIVKKVNEVKGESNE